MGNYGVPVIPVLQAYQVSAATMDRARSQALYSYKAQGISWYVFGQIAAAQFKAVNVTITGTSPDEGDDQTPAEPGKFGREIVVTPTDAAFREGTYDGTPSPLRSFQNEVGWTSRYISTGTTMSQVWARWDPRISEGGFWEIAVYVPSQHATSNNARYKLHGVVGQATEVEVAIRQAPLENAWSSLGVFNLRANDPTAGVIFLNDLTREEDREIAFDAIRWRQITGITHAPSHVADGFDSPVGTIAERAASEFYPKAWFSSMQYGKSYYIGGDSSRPALHTGDDLFARAGEAATAHQPVFATASGVVVSAGKQTGTWGNVIVIRHDPYILSGQVVYSRYAHVETMQVKSGDRVVRGQYICNVGNAYGAFKYHLHFDISHTAVLQSRPWDWPGLNRTRLTENYVNPYEFVAKRRPS
ncbi:MAG: M23 family metallopeptidase [Anaerolineae bacterium]